MIEPEYALLDDGSDLGEAPEENAASAMWDPAPPSFVVPASPAPTPRVSKTQYPIWEWARLGKIIQAQRMRLKMTRQSFGYCIGSSNKSVGRIERGWIFGDPATAPAGDYNSERYVLRRAAFIEMALDWPAGSVKAILDDPSAVAPPGATPVVRSHEDVVRKAEGRKVEDIVQAPEDPGTTKLLRLSREAYRNAEENNTLPAGFVIEVTD